MRYSNISRDAISTMELARTGYYGEDDYCQFSEQECPVCGAYKPDHFFINDYAECVGCSECLHEESRIKK